MGKWITALMLLGCSWSGAATEQYRLDAGDKIQVRVHGHDELTHVFTLSEDGLITFQFLGQLKATGATTSELARRIEQGLRGGYLVNPVVSVGILSYRKFYVKGEVNQPGGYEFEPGLTIHKAIALAGGLSERGSEEKLRLVKGEPAGQQVNDADLTTPVRPGDILIVGKRYF